ncbi:MAG: TIGR03905 family TSCPD domain-containing protein [Clostridia bacterium]|nr:TIGR03905 family TSCPD domain-containing protein [Clostridia bacterium]
MSKKAVFFPQGVCSRQYEITLNDDNIIEDIVIVGGCNGNLQGIARLIKGRPAAEVAESMLGVNCNGRGTSCPDQIARALKEMLA